MTIFTVKTPETPSGMTYSNTIFWFFSKGGGVMSETKLFEELLCLDIFQEEGGGCLIPKFLRNFSA